MFHSQSWAVLSSQIFPPRVSFKVGFLVQCCMPAPESSFGTELLENHRGPPFRGLQGQGPRATSNQTFWRKSEDWYMLNSKRNRSVHAPFLTFGRFFLLFMSYGKLCKMHFNTKHNLSCQKESIYSHWLNKFADPDFL